MKNKIIECMNNIGVFVEENLNDNCQLSELIQDSLTFITLIVELENTFYIEIPDNYLNYESLQTVDDVVQLVNMLKGGESE